MNSLPSKAVDTGEALLERAIAGLLVDGHAYLDEKSLITKHLIEAAREQLIRLSETLAQP